MKIASFSLALIGSILALSPSSAQAAGNGVRKGRDLKGKRCNFDLKDNLYAEALGLFDWDIRRNLAERRADYNYDGILTAWTPLYTVENEECILDRRARGRALHGDDDDDDDDECEEPVMVGFVTYDCAAFGVGDVDDGDVIPYASCDFNFVCMEEESFPQVLGTVTSTGIVGIGYPFDVDYDDVEEGEGFPFGELAITGGTREFNKKKVNGQVAVDYLIANTIRFTFED